MSYAKFLDDVQDAIQMRYDKDISDPDGNLDYNYVRDKWISQRRYPELVSFILENWDSGNGDEFMNPLIEVLIEQKETTQFKRLWKGVLRYRLENLWNYFAALQSHYPKMTSNDLRKINLKNFNQFSAKEDIRRRVAFDMKFTLDGISNFISGLEKLKQNDEITRQENLYEIVSTLQKPKPQPSSDKRKIDEYLFWELIENARNNSPDKYQFIDILKITLEKFQPKEIRNFNKILLTQMNGLNTWNIWALAYITRKGCGDDEFDYFKAWVISKGKKAFDTILKSDIKKLKVIFDEDPQLEELLFLAENIYEEKTFEIMSPPKVKYKPVTGKQWSEDNLEKEYPELTKLFDFQN